MSNPSRPRSASSPAAALRRAASSPAAKCAVTATGPRLGHGHGRNTIVAAVVRLGLTPDQVTLRRFLSEPLQADRGQIFSRVAAGDPAGQPASYRGGARDAKSGASRGGEEALHLRHRADQVRPVGSKGSQASLVSEDSYIPQHGEDGGQPPAGLLHDLHGFLDLRRVESGGQLEVVARWFWLEKPVQVTSLLGPQVATRVGN